MKKLKVRLKPPYPIYIGKNIATRLTSYVKSLDLGNYAIVITNQTIYSIYKKIIPEIFQGSKNIKFKFQILPDTERIKSFPYLLKILNRAGLLDFRKRAFFICWGGGVVGDLGGFAASIYKRGAPYIQIPTTLLSQIDSSIGGKTGIDLKIAKNLIGSFWQPSLVLSDTFFLKTLSTPQIRDGLAEAIKYALINDEMLLRFLEQNCRNLIAKDEGKLVKLVCWCAKIKKQVIEKDERETKGLRTILNFGHTVGHGIETSSQYRISHGKAIALGIISALYISKKERLLEKAETINRIIGLMQNIGLPVKLPLKKTEIIKAVKRDKKFHRGRTRMVLLKKA